ncbi:hypothetical protein BD626DRAFT_501124 [Schizophyllum amplum]|uniref:AB hydrolase-1 domain-containing protein n=1 Tax=Schizophyllum amplum TaxID=97359 RepID=A0A550C9J1_9AGAR|nr:hypothetical protein BD626DRAFT_501124 [Auriculariopsis ampla]
MSTSSRSQAQSSRSQPPPRKSASYLSLRREKDNLIQSPDLSSSSHKSSYFDAYPRSKSSSTPARSATGKSREKERQPASPPPPLQRHGRSADVFQVSDDESSLDSGEDAYAFPRYEEKYRSSTHGSRDREGRTPTAAKYSMRSRSYAGETTASRSSRDVPGLRLSGSSTQNTETPPLTPVDTGIYSSIFDPFPSVVSAPVAGVEAMDALVDGMNGGDVLGSSPSLSMTRTRYGIPHRHPLYEPPLPSPPPGVVLGGGHSRRTRSNPKLRARRDSSGDEDEDDEPPPRPRRRRQPRPVPPRSASNGTITPHHTTSSPPVRPIIREPPSSPHSYAPSAFAASSTSSTQEKRKSMAPSISEIIRAHAPPELQTKPRPEASRRTSVGGVSHEIVREDVKRERERATTAEDGDLVSRSSVDSVADEVQQTLRRQLVLRPQPPPPPPPAPIFRRRSTLSDNVSVVSPRSDSGGGGRASIHSSSAASSYQYQTAAPSFEDLNIQGLNKPTGSQAVAQYLRSARLTTLVKCTRSPHASPDNPLTVSLSDLGSPTGYPVVVFLGLGCVRHIMGLYDEMAECLNLRIITVDRWGLGRTEPRMKSAKGIMQWADVIEEVLDRLHIDTCSVMAHSAGAPYALAFANKLPERIRGEVCLLAPWVGGGENGGYKWLKYVPNGILKTAQAAEWKLQAWMIGKPPTIQYQGIGQGALSPQHTGNGSPHPVHSAVSNIAEGAGRPSTSSAFSEYDDLRDFEGRFGSQTTLGITNYPSPTAAHPPFLTKRKSSKGFLERFKGPSSPTTEEHATPTKPGRKTLKALRSMGSLRSGKSSSKKSNPSSPSSPKLPPPAFDTGLGLGIDDFKFSANSSDSSSLRAEREDMVDGLSNHGSGTTNWRANGQRSISFSSTSPRDAYSMPSSPAPSMHSSQFAAPPTAGTSFQVALGNALIAASHAESAKGTHNDLLQILNHDNLPWGFSYGAYPHRVKVWYGDRDEKIAENAVRWMEHTMGEDRCSVKVVKNADHGLMYKSSVVIEVLEHLLSCWKSER